MRTTIKLLVFALLLSGFTACFPVLMVHRDYNRQGHFWFYNNHRYVTVREYKEARREKEYNDRHEKNENDNRGERNDNRNPREQR